MSFERSTEMRAYCFGGADSEATLVRARAFHGAVVAARAGVLHNHEVYPSANGNTAVWLVYEVYDSAAIDTIYNRATS